jgi:hypothetical protein
VTDDELRAALAAADPAPRSVPPLSRELLERTMTTTLETPADAPARRRRWMPAAAAAAVVAAAAGAYALAGGGEQPTETRLALPGGDTLASCIPVEARFLADMPVALAGTVTEVSGQEVRLDVTRWYQGGDADAVVLTNLSPDAQALLGGTDFRTGESYLVSATDGTVNACGFSGPATAELQQVYDEAFG